ncbi:asparagine synthase (glutamine-hydrolysing) [Lentzea albidocapillata subsp. violacea]|uniref:asparagine synthase (glutamine-hydrolyzing) n=1 Tax=Lentzea albidocapillata subsp. violacea TaxID=128104 RepID=A0A1G9LTS0_9PSEU|nr:asparagine synthase (glutamine-hydrolyzing) [Lentzea albidocapillata]SDL65204.1 asparagine synthase (glutamine-hydrolysing) [Lentzea albidocapillata subsp. violacea]
MSGMAGWVDFGRGVGVEGRRVAETMADAVAHRGPHGAGGWSDHNAALAHRRLEAVDADRSPQPAVATDGDQAVAVLMIDGAITNIAELRSRTGVHARSAGVADVVLSAYLTWGVDFAAHLEGMFAVVLWDVRERRLVLVRDRLGVKPLSYAVTATGAVFGSEPKAVLAHPGITAEVDEDGLRELFAHGKMPGTSVFRGLREVRPGHAVVVDGRAMTEHRYWTLAAWRHADDLPTTVERVRALLADSVAGHVGGDPRMACMLSGGVDSSALTALAHQARGDLATYSLSFVGYAEKFEPHPTMRATPDSPFAWMVADHVGTRHEEILLDTDLIADPGAHARAMRGQDAASPLGDMDVSLLLFFEALRDRGVRAVLSGETADEVFNGYFWAYDPKHSNTTTFPWVSFERGHDAAVGGLGCSLIDLSLRRQLDFLGYADQHYRDALAEVPVLGDEDAAQRRAREVTYLALTRWAPTHLDRADRLSMSAGVQLRPPFCDRALVEYVYNVPAELKRVNEREKSLLRAAVADLLPQPVLERRKSAYPTTQDVRYGEVVRARFAELASDSGAVVAPLLDQAAVKAAMSAESAPRGAFAWVERASMEMVLQLDAWLTEYRVRIVL